MNESLSDRMIGWLLEVVMYAIMAMAIVRVGASISERPPERPSPAQVTPPPSTDCAAIPEKVGFSQGAAPHSMCISRSSSKGFYRSDLSPEEPPDLGSGMDLGPVR